jgi:thioredoxin 1
LDEHNFDKELVLIDFYSEWCGAFKRLKPVLEMVSDDMQGQVSIHKVNYDDPRDLAKCYDISSLPTLVLFEEGKRSSR